MQNRSLLRIVWYTAFGVILVALCIWIVWSIRQRKSSRQAIEHTQAGETGSAYLPLNEMPSRHFDALADAIDELEPYEKWTAKARTVRQVDAPPPDADATRVSGKPGNKKRSLREVTLQRIPNLFKPKK